MPAEAVLRVEVAYARPEEQLILPVDVPEGSTVVEAIRASGILERFPEIDLSAQPVGVFSRIVDLDETLRAHDRVEIYRPLQVDPKEMRRKRAREQGRGGAAHWPPRVAGASARPVAIPRFRPGRDSPAPGRPRPGIADRSGNAR